VVTAGHLAIRFQTHYTNADAHNSAASSRPNWRPRRFKWTRPFRGKHEIWFLRVCHHVSNSVYLPTTLGGVIKLETTYAQFLLHLTEKNPVSCCNCSMIRTCLVARKTTDSSYPDFLYKQLALTTVLYLHVRAALRAWYHTAPSEIMTTSTKYKPEYLQYVGFGLTYFELWNHYVVQGHHVVQKKKTYTNLKLEACQRQTSSCITLAHCLFSKFLCLSSKHSSLASLSYSRRRLVIQFVCRCSPSFMFKPI